MGWFERQLNGRPPEDLEDELGRFVRAAGVDRALLTLCGPFGVRRFVIRFERLGDTIKLTDLETHPLPYGGGPPDPLGAEEGIAPLEAAINRLNRNMLSRLPWERGAVAVVRDALDQIEIMPLFDEDADDAVLADIGIPEPPGHPLEGHQYREMVAGQEALMAGVHGETSRRRGSWTGWEIGADDLSLVLDHISGTSRLKTMVLGTFHPASGRFAWATDALDFNEPVFSTRSFSASFDAVMELGMATTARVGAAWLFIEKMGEGDDIVIAAVWG
jgi:hypothetical protein